MVDDFADKTAHLSKESFVEVVEHSLNEKLGRSTASAVIYHMGGNKSIQKPEVFESKLKTLLGNSGGDIILKNILKNLEPIVEEPSIKK